MSEFRVGDRVRVKGMSPDVGIGTVVETYLGFPETVDVWFDGSVIDGHLASELEHID